MKNLEKREAIIRTANHLFESRGFNGVGVDLIASESGVTKRTLYKHFGSKEGLIRAVLEAHHEATMLQIREQVLSIESGARDQLRACFELYRDWFSRSNFSGCIFIKTLNEFGGCSTELGRIAQAAKDSVHLFLSEIAGSGGVKEPGRLATELQLLLEGSIVLAQSGRGPEVISFAREVADSLIDCACS